MKQKYYYIQSIFEKYSLKRHKKTRNNAAGLEATYACNKCERKNSLKNNFINVTITEKY